MVANSDNESKKLFVWFGLALTVIFFDQLTKQLIIGQMELYERVEILPFFNLFYIHNLGAAFGFLSDQPGWQRWFFTIVSALVSVAIVVWLTKLKPSQRLLAVALSLVLGGALGNLFDRIIYGYVIDFIDWHLMGYHWPSFNIADMAISLGAILLIIDTFVNPESTEQ